MYRYVAYYKYDIFPEESELTEHEINEINEIFDTDNDFNPMINKVFHECVSRKGNYSWDDVPQELDTKVTGWNWKLKDNTTGYVEILSNESLSQEELDIMTRETEGQISDGYNENPFVFKLSNGKTYSIMFHEWAYQEFKEE